VHNDADLQQRIQGLVTFRKSSSARKSLASPFNFAPFYLDDFVVRKMEAPQPTRLIYLDTDVVVVEDIAELHDMDLGGQPAAAVEDCFQHFELYIDFVELRSRGLDKGFDPKACVFNRGVFVVDVVKWREARITSDIEMWMARYKDSKKDLYRYGMSQPPWLLALGHRYQRMHSKWNCRGLGREALDITEFKDVQAVMGLRSKADKKSLKIYQDDKVRPFISTCSADAGLLHFNGAMKPWLSGKWGKKKAPLCAIPALQLSALPQPVPIKQRVERCEARWWAFLSEAGAVALQKPAGGAG